MGETIKGHLRKGVFFEIYQSKDKGRQNWRWRFYGPGIDADTLTLPILAISEEPFSSFRACECSIKALIRNVKSKKAILDTAISSKDKRGYWRLRSRNGRTLAKTPKGYGDTDLLFEDYKKLIKFVARGPKIVKL